MPPTLGRSTIGARRSWWSQFFGAGTSEPQSPVAVGSIRVAPDAPSRSNYTGTILARAPLRELGTTDVRRVADLTGDRRVGEVRFALGVSRANRRADALQSVLDSARAARTQGAPSADVATQAARFAGAFHWALSIPGTHYSGLSNNALMEVMEANGRPFLSDTPELRDHVRDRLVAAFASAAWDAERAVAVAARAVREWIVRRIDEQGLDVDLKPLDGDYRSAKIADGHDGRIGIRTRAWRGSVANAVVEVAA